MIQRGGRTVTQTLRNQAAPTNPTTRRIPSVLSQYHKAANTSIPRARLHSPPPFSAPSLRYTRLNSTMAPTSTPRAVVISGPSGTGKSTILNRLFKEYPDTFGFSISHTTRAPRGTEQNGVEYHFVTKEEFLDRVGKNEFIEHAQFGSNCYGTTIKAVEDVEKQGRICVLDIEMEGVKQVANHSNFPRPRFLFLSPPSMEILEERLRGRATDKEEAIQKRLDQAKNEMEFANSGNAPHDLIVVNDDLEKAYQEVKKFCVEDAA